MLLIKRYSFLGQLTVEKRISIILSYLPFKGDQTLHLNKGKRHIPKDVFVPSVAKNGLMVLEKKIKWETFMITATTTPTRQTTEQNDLKSSHDFSSLS